MALRIKELREDNDLTQAQIASILKCTQSSYSKYEKGKRNIPYQYLIMLADFYDVSLDYLMGRSDKMK